MNQLIPQKKPMSPKRKKLLLADIIILFIIQVVGVIVAEVFHLSRHSGLLPSFVVLLSAIPFCSMVYIGEKWADENNRVFLKYFLLFLLCAFGFAIVFSLVFIIVPRIEI